MQNMDFFVTWTTDRDDIQQPLTPEVLIGPMMKDKIVTPHLATDETVFRQPALQIPQSDVLPFLRGEVGIILSPHSHSSLAGSSHHKNPTLVGSRVAAVHTFPFGKM